MALYIEMYGFPLTMYIITGILGYNTLGCMWFPLARLVGEELFVNIFLGIILPISNSIILGGLLLIIFGWKKIHNTKNKLVTTGIYKHLRHPQYLGFLLLTLGMNFIWMAITTTLMWPILAFLYYRLAKEEEKQMQQKFKQEYTEYKTKVPMFLPKIKTNL
jgi:protein-S-isoprenylcysteine O-methyltransferase Ste14